MRAKKFLLIAVATLVALGCARVNMGKIDLSAGDPPYFLQIGQTTADQVISRIGEPLGYREKGSRSAMIYFNCHEDYVFFFFGELRTERSYRLDLVFENNTLIKAEVRKEGWGMHMGVDANLIRLLAG